MQERQKVLLLQKTQFVMSVQGEQVWLAIKDELVQAPHVVAERQTVQLVWLQVSQVLMVPLSRGYFPVTQVMQVDLLQVLQSRLELVKLAQGKHWSVTA